MVSHTSHSFSEADQWDLAFWQSQSPEDRLSALVHLHEDLRKIETSRKPR